MQEHHNNLDLIVKVNNINSVLDAGSGRTSLNYLTSRFPNAKIDAIVYPGDLRKINSIKENVVGEYNLIEMDLCKDSINTNYDLVFAHLLLGEATKFGNSFSDLLKRLLSINAKYFLIYDFMEDPTVDYRLIEEEISKNFKLISYMTFKKEEEQVFTHFVGKNYVAYFIKNRYLGEKNV